MFSGQLSGKVLLIGGTGFLGSTLLKKLQPIADHLILLKRSFSDTRRIQDLLPQIISYNIDELPFERAFQEHPIEAIINCATDYGRKNPNPTQLIEANLLTPLTLLQLAHKYKTRVFVNTDTILDKRVSHYSLSKNQFLDWLEVYSNDMVCVNMALEHFFGPDDDPTKFVTWVIQGLVNNLHEMNFTPGEQKRDFIYIDDVVQAFEVVLGSCLNLSSGFYHFEVGSGRTIEIREFLKMAKNLAQNKSTQLNFGALPYRKNEVMNSQLNLEKLLALGWSPQTSLEEGLAKTIAFEKTRIVQKSGKI